MTVPGNDPADLTATAALRRFQADTLTPAALMEACLSRIAAREPIVRAFAHLDPDLARGSAARPAAGRLHGLPIGVKDVIDTAALPSAYGSPIWAGHRPRADAACVAWARAEGAVVIGKTVTTEFAYRHPGPTTNPHQPAHTPGGSSSGSAAGIAAGFFPLAFGTQTAGSVIRPASFCGVVGYKPSFGLINRTGVKPLADTLDTVGVMARSVADCALFAGALAGRDLGDPDADPGAAPRIGVCRSPAWAAAAPEMVALIEQLPARLAAAGAAVSRFELPADYAAIEAAHAVVMNTEAVRALGFEFTTARAQLSEVLRERLEWGLAQPEDAFDAARATLARLRHGFAETMAGVDVLVTPAAPGEAPEGLGFTGNAAFNLIWTSLHLPCVTVPAGSGPKGLPLGVQIVGRWGADRATLAAAQWVAAAMT